MGLLLFVLPFIPFSFFPDFSSKISPQPLKIETSYLVYRFTTTLCIVGLKMGFLLFVLPYVFFSFSPDFSLKISPQPFKIETSNLVYRFTKIWYTGSQRQVVSWDRKWAFSYLFFPIFFLFSFSPDFIIFGIQVHNDKLYRGIENGFSPICSPLCFFSFSPDFSLKISPQPFKIETSNLVYRFTKIWYTGSQRQVVSWDRKWAFSYLFFPIFFLFSFSPDFSSKISPQPFKIETSCLV